MVNKKSVWLLTFGECQLLNLRADVLFSNVKHLFFQPCEHELLVLIHLHLRAPIMIGKKKTFVRRCHTKVHLLTCI